MSFIVIDVEMQLPYIGVVETMLHNMATLIYAKHQC